MGPGDTCRRLAGKEACAEGSGRPLTQQSEQKLLGGDLVVENVDSLVVIHPEAGPGPDDGAAQVGIPLHVR